MQYIVSQLEWVDGASLPFLFAIGFLFVGGLFNPRAPRIVDVGTSVCDPLCLFPDGAGSPHSIPPLFPFPPAVSHEKHTDTDAMEKSRLLTRNYGDHQDPAILAVACSLAGVMLIIVVLRLYVRKRYSRLRIDDWAHIASCVRSPLSPDHTGG